MKSVELFCGAGGASVGMRAAGFEGQLHVDHDADSCETMRAAGFENVVHGFVQQLERLDIPDAPFWWSSPPCPPWATSGHRKGSQDPRNGYPHLFRALKLRTPRWLVIEQVEGITFHRRGCLGRRTGRSTDPEGCPACYLHGVVVPYLRLYFSVVEMSVLDASDHGVPQRRSRLITVCGPGRVPWPSPTHSSESLEEAKGSGDYWRAIEDGTLFEKELPIGDDGCRPYRTMRQVLPALRREGFVIGGGRHPGRPGEERFYRNLTDDPSTTVAAQYGGSAGNLGPFVLTSGSRGDKGSLLRDVDGPSPSVSTAGDLYEVEGRPDWWYRSSPVDEPSRTVGSRGNASVSLSDEGGRRLRVRLSEQWRLDLPSPTVSASEVKGAGNRSTRKARGEEVQSTAGPDRPSDVLLLATGRRRLEPEECAILQDFPKDHPFCGKRGSVYTQVGNACPPELVRVVVREVLLADRRGR